MRFMIIDDSMPMRRIVANVLARLGHTDLVFAANGREALKRIESERIDFVITDWFMPEMTGIEFLRTLRDNEATRELPIMIVTANASRTDVAQAMKLKVNGYVLKPFTAEFLKERIGAICASVAPDDPQDAARAEAADTRLDTGADAARLETGADAASVEAEAEAVARLGNAAAV